MRRASAAGRAVRHLERRLSQARQDLANAEHAEETYDTLYAAAFPNAPDWWDGKTLAQADIELLTEFRRLKAIEQKACETEAGSTQE